MTLVGREEPHWVRSLHGGCPGCPGLPEARGWTEADPGANRHSIQVTLDAGCSPAPGLLRGHWGAHISPTVNLNNTHTCSHSHSCTHPLLTHTYAHNHFLTHTHTLAHTNTHSCAHDVFRALRSAGHGPLSRVEKEDADTATPRAQPWKRPQENRSPSRFSPRQREDLRSLHSHEEHHLSPSQGGSAFPLFALDPPRRQLWGPLD